MRILEMSMSTERNSITKRRKKRKRELKKGLVRVEGQEGRELMN